MDLGALEMMNESRRAMLDHVQVRYCLAFAKTLRAEICLKKFQCVGTKL